MKKMIILLVFVTSMQICFAQDTVSLKTPPLTVKEEYLKKSKKQKKAGSGNERDLPPHFGGN